jgi:hypothetical protein
LLADSGTVSTAGYTVGGWNLISFSGGFVCAAGTAYTLGVYSTGTYRYSPADLSVDQVSGDGHVRALAHFGRFVNAAGAVFPTGPGSPWDGMFGADLDYALGGGPAFDPRRASAFLTFF